MPRKRDDDWLLEATSACGCTLTVNYRGKSTNGVTGTTCSGHGEDRYSGFVGAPIAIQNLVKAAKLYLRHVGYEP